jgi:hypothetical protein
MGGAIKDSGQRQEFGTGSVRDTEVGKGRPDLAPTLFLRRVFGWLEQGSGKYGDRNWERGQPLSRYYSSAMRHLMHAFDGDTSEDNEAAAAWNIMAFMWTREMIKLGVLPKELDDRPRYNGRLVADLIQAKMLSTMKDPMSLEELRESLNTESLGDSREKRADILGVDANRSVFTTTVFSSEYKLK